MVLWVVADMTWDELAAQLCLFTRYLYSHNYFIHDPTMPETLDRSLSSLSLNSVPEDDWDGDTKGNAATTTPRNSIVFPVDQTPTHSKNASVQNLENGKGNRTLSDLLRLHSEKDSTGSFSPEEAARIADVLGQWVGVPSLSHT